MYTLHSILNSYTGNIKINTLNLNSDKIKITDNKFMKMKYTCVHVVSILYSVLQLIPKQCSTLPLLNKLFVVRMTRANLELNPNQCFTCKTSLCKWLVINLSACLLSVYNEILYFPWSLEHPLITCQFTACEHVTLLALLLVWKPLKHIHVATNCQLSHSNGLVKLSRTTKSRHPPPPCPKSIQFKLATCFNNLHNKDCNCITLLWLFMNTHIFFASHQKQNLEFS